MRLLSLARMMRLTAPSFTLLAQQLSGRDTTLICGGLFLLWKRSTGIWGSLETLGFSAGVEVLDIRTRKRRAVPV